MKNQSSKPDEFPEGSERDTQLSDLAIWLRSQRPSDTWTAFEHAKQWLNEYPEDREVYALLLEAVRERTEIRGEVRDLLEVMNLKGSRTAQEALSLLPSSVRDLLADADDAYYSAQYERAIELYQAVLKQDPDHQRANERLAKAKLGQLVGDSSRELPREAIQYLRRARLFIAVGEFPAAMAHTKAAIAAAQAKGVIYEAANELLGEVERLVRDQSEEEQKRSRSFRWKRFLVRILLPFLVIAIVAVLMEVAPFKEIPAWSLGAAAVAALLWGLIQNLFSLREEVSIPSSPLKEVEPGKPPDSVLHDRVASPWEELLLEGEEKDDSSDEVTFTAYYPKEGKVETWYTLLVYTHLLSLLGSVRKDARKFLDEIGEPKEVQSALPTRLVQGTAIRIVPACEGVVFNPDHVDLKWVEDFQRADFRFKADQQLADDAARGQIDIFLGPLIIGSLKFVLLINDKDSSLFSEWEEQAKMYSRDDIFISYSRKDTELVNVFKTVLEATGLDVFIDVEDILTGDLWEEVIEQRIERAKIFQMFWSLHYSESENCRQEWEHALQQNRGVGYIRPVYWKSPLSPTPPDPLKKLNFKYVELKLPQL